MKYRFRILEFLLEAGYLFNPGKPLHAEGDSKLVLLNAKGDVVKPDWSGYRFGVGVGIDLYGLGKVLK